MAETRKKPIIATLGGIGSGKTSVAAEFARLGCGLIDADEIAHELLKQPNVKKNVTDLFGDGVLDTKGQIDRGKLAQIVFADVDKIKLLNSIIHPPVLKKTEELIARYERDSRVKAIVVDMPLLVEVGWDKRCDKLIFVDCEEQIRAQRMGKMGFLSKSELKLRENFQISLDNKKTLADNVIDNNSDFAALKKQVAEIFSDIVNNG